MALLDLSRIDKAVQIAAPPERVWRALTDPAELQLWFNVSIEGLLEPGALVWMTSVLPSQRGVRFSVRIVEMTPPIRLVWQWHPGEVDPSVNYDEEPMTTVTFTIEPVAGGSVLRVAETGFEEVSLARRAKVYRDNEAGWGACVESLKVHVEGR